MQLEKKQVPYSKTGYFSKLITGYLSKEKKLSSFYKYAPSIESFGKVIADKGKEKIDRGVLVNVLSNQYAGIGKEKFPDVFKNILLLKDQDTFTVCTGHQLCMFTGPLYFIYKIITTINLAESLRKAYPKNNFVPIYWMASEDHDFEEVNHIHIAGKKITWNPHPGKDEKKNAMGAVGNMGTESLSLVIAELKSVLGDSEHAKILVNLFSDAYLKHKNLSDATRYLVNEFFGVYGLVIIDAEDGQLKRIFSEDIRNDILEGANFKSVNESIKALDELGVHAQVNPREINSFYMKLGLRERIEDQDGVYRVLNTEISFSKEELLEEIEKHPERFSPNVILRPLYQEKILPNLAYIGGGGELAYWLQYKEMFERNKINFPVLVLRNSVLWIDVKSSKKIEQLKLDVEKVFLKEDVLINDFIKEQFSKTHNLGDEEEVLKKLYTKLGDKAGKIDVTLKASVEAAMQRGINGLERIELKMLRAEKRKQEVLLNQIKALKYNLFPNGELQERYDNLCSFYVSYGNGFIAMLKDHLDPMDLTFLLLEEKG